MVSFNLHGDTWPNLVSPVSNQRISSVMFELLVLAASALLAENLTLILDLSTANNRSSQKKHHQDKNNVLVDT